MEWKVVNALSRDIERQQINKIFKEIQVEFTKLKQPVVSAPSRPPSPPARSPVTITLQGDVTGSANGTGQITIQTVLADELTGIGDAPDDGSVYWRGSQQWQEVPLALQFFYDLTGEGLLSINADGVLTPRVIDSDVEDIVVENGDGVNDSPYLYLADVEDIGGGVLQKTAFDSKGRKTGTSAATTDDLGEGVTNLYFTEERAVDAVQELLDEKLDYTSLKETLVAGANITLTPDDLDETITITSTGGGGGGGGIEAIIGGTGIEVDDTAPETPIVSISEAVLDRLDLADTSLQPGDNISELMNNVGYVTETEAAAAAPVQSVNTQTGDVVLTAEDVGAIEDAPIDGEVYGRQDGDWVGIPVAGGTVTSVGASVPTGLSVTGTPITSSGVITLSWSAGYQGYTTAEASKLAGIQSGAQVNVSTNIAEGSRTATSVPITSSTGTGATLSAATTTLAGVMSSADKTKLNGIATGATVGANWNTNLSNIPSNIVSWASITPTTKANASDTLNLTGNQTYTGIKTALEKTITPTLVISGIGGGIPSYEPGCFYSDENWGLLMRANTASPAVANVAMFSGAGVGLWQVGLDNSFLPSADNDRANGGSVRRWSQIFSATGTINTSDAREKYTVNNLSTNEVKAAIALSKEVKVYQWTDAVNRKGAGARWHVGMTVQRAIEIMQSFNLDPFKYAFICYDEWPEEAEIWQDLPPTLDSSGKVLTSASRILIRPYRAAGNRYAFRMDQLNSFMVAGLNQRLLEVETKPSPKVNLGNITLKETATVAIAAGDRTLTFTVPGLRFGDDVLLFPSTSLPLGYIIKSAVATADNTLRVTLQVPLLALGSSYSITCKVVTLR